MPRPAFTLGLLVGGLVLPPALAPAQDAAPAAPPARADRDNPLRGNEITPAQQAAVDKGLAYLAAHQQPDGNFGGMSGGGAGSAITALSAVALMGAGNLPGRGKYGDKVARAVDAIVANAQPNGLLADGSSGGTMYAHGFATLFLGEVYGMTGDERVKEPLTRAIRLISKTQNNEGGWRYTPAPLDADISVTICQVMALRAARDAGIKVEKSTVDNAVKYVKSLQNPDGGFNYTSSSGNSSLFPRSAAGVATLYYAGESGGKAIESGLDYLERFRPSRNNADNINGHYFYGHYYAAQAMFLAGGEHWAKWYPAVRDELVARQQPDGSWNGEVAPEYCTAMALIVLQMPNRYLPVFSGKGAGG